MSRLAGTLAGATLVLLFIGGMVTSTGSGLATGDWPLPEGKVLPPMKGEMLFEHGHRLVAAAVGILTVVLAVALLFRESRRWVRWLGVLSVALVSGQGLLGMLTVRMELPPGVSIAHAAVSQIFLAVVVALAYFTSREGSAPPEVRIDDPALPKRTLLMTALIYTQILFGALYRHTGKMLVLHLLGAATVFFVVGWGSGALVKQGREVPGLRSSAIGLMVLLTIQILLGFASLGIVTTDAAKNIDAPLGNALLLSLHLLVGGAMFALGVLLTLRTHRLAAVPAGEPLTEPGRIQPR